MSTGGPDWEAFGRAILAERDGWDGFDLQDLGVEHGVLIAISVTEPCGDGCVCAEYADEWPTTCYRVPEAPGDVLDVPRFLRRLDD